MKSKKHLCIFLNNWRVSISIVRQFDGLEYIVRINILNNFSIVRAVRFQFLKYKNLFCMLRL